jgi:capsid protein
MAPRKKDPKPAKSSARKKSTTAPQAASSGATFNNQYSGNQWGSTVQTYARRVIYAPQPDDMRRDLSPWDRNEMVKKCRWAERESALFRQILNDLTIYVVGDGIKPQSHAENPETARLYEEYFAREAKRIDVSGKSFYQCQSILIRALIRDGDAFAIKVVNGDRAQIQIIEAHRVGDPTDADTPADCWDGIGFGKYNEPIYYSVYQADGSSRKVEAQSVMHVMDMETASGSRGVPVLQSSLNGVQDVKEILELERRAVKDNGDVTRVIKKGSGFLDDDAASEISSNHNSAEIIASQMGGKAIVLESSDSFESFESKRPNSTFVGFLAALEKDICSILPYEFVKDVTTAGGAGVRLVTAKAARVFGKYANVMTESFCQPTWEYIIADGIARGEIPDDPRWWATSWTTPKSVTVDAGRESSSDRADLEMGRTSLSEDFSLRGLDFRTEVARRADDMAYIVSEAQRVNIPFWMLYKPGFNWLQQGQASSQLPNDVAGNLEVPPPPKPPQP